jgi:signal transduction histidine kinase
MHSEETRIFLAILTAVIILFTLITFFAVSIVRYSRMKVAAHREKIIADTIVLEKERERIAADLHDDLGATLSAIKIKLQCLEMDEVLDQSIFEDVQKLIDVSMKKLRQISYNVMPLILNRKGLHAALNEFIENSTTEKLNIKLDYSVSKLPKEKEIHILRIIQGIISNVLKHSKATDVKIIFKETRQLFILQIIDNGIGFNKANVQKTQTGVGLQNIMARVEMLKGTVYLATEKGVNYIIEIPKNV